MVVSSLHRHCTNLERKGTTFRLRAGCMQFVTIVSVDGDCDDHEGQKKITICGIWILKGYRTLLHMKLWNHTFELIGPVCIEDVYQDAPYALERTSYRLYMDCSTSFETSLVMTVHKVPVNEQRHSYFSTVMEDYDISMLRISSISIMLVPYGNHLTILPSTSLSPNPQSYSYITAPL